MMDWINEMGRVVAGKNGMLDAAARYVIGIGYQPSECLIESQRINDYRDRDRLLVRGQPFFEVVTDRKTDTDAMAIRFTFTPRVINWPPLAIDAPAPASTPMSGIPR